MQHLPADPVSVSLAYRSAIRAHIPEDKLAYGFKSAPINAATVKEIKHIPEEKLWDSDRTVMELRPYSHTPDVSEEEEFHEDEEVEQSHYNAANIVGYHELGYLPQKHHDAKFKSHKFANSYESEATECDAPSPQTYDPEPYQTQAHHSHSHHTHHSHPHHAHPHHEHPHHAHLHHSHPHHSHAHNHHEHHPSHHGNHHLFQLGESVNIDKVVDESDYLTNLEPSDDDNSSDRWTRSTKQ